MVETSLWPSSSWIVRDADGRLAGAASLKEALLVPAFAGELRCALGGLVVATS